MARKRLVKMGKCASSHSGGKHGAYLGTVWIKPHWAEKHLKRSCLHYATAGDAELAELLMRNGASPWEYTTAPDKRQGWCLALSLPCGASRSARRSMWRFEPSVLAPKPREP